MSAKKLLIVGGASAAFGVLVAMNQAPNAPENPVPQPAVSPAPSPSPPASDQDAVVGKTKDALAQATAGGGYTRSEYSDTYKELGRIAFSKLNLLEPGALYAAAESKQCDRVITAGLNRTGFAGGSNS